MKRKLTLKGRILICFVLVVCIILTGYFFLFRDTSPIHFKDDHPKIQVNTHFDALTLIESVDNGKKSEVTCDSHQLNMKKVGDYQITYKFKDEAYQLDISVVDEKKPTFTIKDIEIDLGMQVIAKDLVSDIQDDSKTTVSFKKDYSFSSLGQKKVKVTVKDQYNNATTKSAIVTVLSKDSTKPTISGLTEKSVTLNEKVDWTNGVIVKDNRDPHPTLKVNTQDLDLKTIGTYTITYKATDRSGNTTNATRKIKVVKEIPVIGSTQQSNEKVVYLTFDDGPSENTAKILSILDQYHAKATFFVTGNGQQYNNLITEASNKGHTIGLHTYCHEYNQIYASTEAYFKDLKKISDMVEKLIGKKSHYIRFPGGASNTVSRHYCQGIMTTLSKEVIEQGYQYYDWNCGTGDAEGNNIPANKLISNACNAKGNNLVMLAHDTQAKSTTVQALPAIIQHYQSLGYTFKGIDDHSFVPHQHVNN